jgi:uncharacterized protein (DUF697 family)/tellurite resistance protein
MSEQEQKAILTLSLMAAFADGGKDEVERAEVKRIAESLTTGTSINLAAIYQDVLLKRASLDDAVRELQSPEAKQLAYEMAVCVCNADGTQNEQERTFLSGLREKLGLEAAGAQAFAAQADAAAASPLDVSSAVEPKFASTMTAEEMDKMILNYSILNGALELLPDSLASMAIIPLQMRMVYRVGKSHGFELDRGHIKDFLATAGVGMTSQYVEQIGVKLVGGLLRKIAGRTVSGIGRQATSSAFSFATTYALGHVAKRYYAGGRTLDTAALKEAFSEMLSEAKALQERYSGEIQAKAKTIDVRQILSAVRQ